MIPVPAGVHTDMRRGFPGLALLVQETLKRCLCSRPPRASQGLPKDRSGSDIANLALYLTDVHPTLVD